MWPAGVEEETSALRPVTSPLPPLVRPGGCMDLWELIVLCLTVVVLYVIQTFGTRGRSAPAPGNRWNRSPKKG